MSLKNNNEDKNRKIEYTEDLQRLFIQIMLSCPELYVLSQNIIKDNYFVKNLHKSIRFIQEYSEKYKSVPSSEQVFATSNEKFDIINVKTDMKEWFISEIENFCRHKEMEDIVINSGPEVLSSGKYAILEERFKKAMTISLQKDLGTDYFLNPKGRLENMRENQNVISTGWKYIDEKLYGGWGRKTLNIFAGQPGAGKSLFLQNLALNYLEMGMNVAYITLELSQDLVSMRFDSMISGFSTKELFRKIDDVELKIFTFKKTNKPGNLTIKKLPEGGTTTNTIRAYLKEYEIQTGIHPDVIIVDYLDLLYPNTVGINLNELFIKDKYTSEELRSLAFEWDAIVVTASQLNRDSMSPDVSDFDQRHIAGGISKINTADNVLAILGTTHMRENGEYQIQFLKTRSSAGVGSKVNLKYDIVSLRITDLDDIDGSYKRDTRDELTRKAKIISKAGNEAKPPVNDFAALEMAKKNQNNMLKIIKDIHKDE